MFSSNKDTPTYRISGGSKVMVLGVALLCDFISVPLGFVPLGGIMLTAIVFLVSYAYFKSHKVNLFGKQFLRARIITLFEVLPFIATFLPGFFISAYIVIYLVKREDVKRLKEEQSKL